MIAMLKFGIKSFYTCVVKSMTQALKMLFYYFYWHTIQVALLGDKQLLLTSS